MSVIDIIPLLWQVTKHTPLSPSEDQLLQEYCCYQQNPFTEQKQTDIYQQKKALFSQVYPAIASLCQQQLQVTDKDKVISTLWSFWLPLALELAQKYQQQSVPLIVGILGGQGTGKTTLTKILPLIWQELNLTCAALSIDDLYKTYNERQELLKTDPRLIWRGPPATHDINLGLDVLTRLQNREANVALPRFDKSAYQGAGDRANPEIVNSVDIIILEGWFVGATPVNEQQLQNCPFPIVSQDERQFAIDNNQRLQAYLPLWEKLDYLMVLHPQEYQYSLQWRKEAEHQMIAQGKTGMSDEQIKQFVYYFWQALHPEIFITPLTKNSQTTDLVVEIDSNHAITNIYRP